MSCYWKAFVLGSTREKPFTRVSQSKWQKGERRGGRIKTKCPTCETDIIEGFTNSLHDSAEIYHCHGNMRSSP